MCRYVNERKGAGHHHHRHEVVTQKTVGRISPSRQALVAQWIERPPSKRRVVGSSLTQGTFLSFQVFLHELEIPKKGTPY